MSKVYDYLSEELNRLAKLAAENEVSFFASTAQPRGAEARVSITAEISKGDIGAIHLGAIFNGILSFKAFRPGFSLSDDDS
jgi:hypothetical protein